MMISRGAALFTARLALRYLGYRPQTSLLPDPDRPALIARISWDERAPASEYEQQLFDQVMRRRTHRGGFDPAPLPAELLAILRRLPRRRRCCGPPALWSCSARRPTPARTGCTPGRRCSG
jgi:hypothetical protein